MENITASKNKTHQIVAWTLLAGLLLLRLPFLAGIAMFSDPEWLDPAFQIGTYLLTACLIWWERDRLADFHIDKLALGIIIFFKPIQTLLLARMVSNNQPLAFPNPPSLALWIISLGLFLALWLSHAPIPKVSRSSWRWFGVGALVLGGLVWRSKTISSSLAAHAAMNAFGLPVAYIIASLRL
jgi:hypothetical protein